jgi:hypothetical protein
MTGGWASASMEAGGHSQRPGDDGVAACGFCRRRLADEYFFTCLRCEASYCYIHMSRHQPAACARHVWRRKRSSRPSASTGAPRQGVPLVFAESNRGGSRPSANV